MAQLNSQYESDRMRAKAHMDQLMTLQRDKKNFKRERKLARESDRNKAISGSIGLAEQGYGSAPLGMSPEQSTLYSQASLKGAEAKSQREGQGMFAANLYKEMEAYNPALYREQVTDSIYSEMATPEKVDEWLTSKEGRAYQRTPEYANLRMQGGADGGEVPMGVPLHPSSPAFKMLQRRYIASDPMIQAQADQAILSIAGAREAKHMSQTNQFNTLTNAGVNWYPYYNAQPQAGQDNPLLPQGKNEDSESKTEGSGGGSEEEEEMNPILGGALRAAGTGGLAYGAGRMTTTPYRAATSTLYGRQLSTELKRATNNLARTPSLQWNTPRSAAGPNPALAKAQSEIDSVMKSQRSLLKANGVQDVAQLSNQEVTEQLKQMVEDGKIKKIPKADKALAKKLGKGVLSSVWKKALAAVGGATATGASGANPWTTAAGFIAGLGMAAWTVHDVYGIAKDLMSE